MSDENINQRPPDFAPGFPLYPPLPQFVRVTGSAVSGTSPRVYPAVTQQFFPPLSFRDRETCYVVEPNNVTLNSGSYYDCRLVGSYNNQPLYATSCCTVGSSSVGG